MKLTAAIVRGMTCLCAILVTSAASAAVSKVIGVPWQGDTTKFHTTTDGSSTTLKAVVKTTSTSTIWYQWNYGDGASSAILSTSGNTWYAVESAHTYSGADGTPFTARLTVADSADLLTNPISDPYLVKIEDNTLDARINIAIDTGLWYTYKAGTRHDGVTGTPLTYDGMPFVVWNQTGRAAATASAVQSFEINGSKESGNFDEDPYAEYAALGLKFLIMGVESGNPILRALTIGLQHGTDNPDSNANGIGIEAFDAGNTYPPYQGGTVMDAFIASGTPAKSSGREFVTGHVATYGDIIQDMVDMYAWGQYDGSNCRQVQTGTENVLTYSGTPQSITFEMLNTQCGNGGTFDFYLNGTALATGVANDPANSCVCTPTPQTVTTASGTAQTAWESDASKKFRVVYTGGGYNAWVHVILDYGGGNVQTICLRMAGASCDDVNLCNAGYNAIAFDVTVDPTAFPTYTNECDPFGGWVYGWNQGNDNSTSQWAAIGMIPAQASPWNATVPQWVKDYDNGWLDASFTTTGGGIWGHFGYQSASPLDGPYGYATTPSGMVQLSFDDMTVADTRWEKGERWMAENWDSGDNWLNQARGNIYSMYAMTKAMRLAKPAPVVNFAATGLDWYRGSSSQDGIAKVLSDNIIANGSYSGGDRWESNPMTTEWAVIMLKPTLFAASPIACFTAHPNPSFSDLPISFDPTCSGHSEPGKGLANLTKFEWDWDNDGVYDLTTTTPDVVSHAFHCASVPCTFPVKLRVTDDNNPALTATFVMDIRITDPPHPPVSKPGGPYLVSLCAADTLKLDGSASFDPDQGQHESGCSTCPNDTIIAWDWDLDGAPFDYTSASGPIVDLGTGFRTDFPSAGTYNIGLRVTDNTAHSYPDSGQPNLTDEGFAQVQVYNAGPCQLTATPQCESIKLDWADVHADSYDVYRSSTSANAGFALVGTTTALTYNDPIGFNQMVWYRILAKTGTQLSMSPAVSAIDTVNDCICISGFVSNAKNLQVQLNWNAVAGASCYNVYRSTSPNVALVAGNRIGSCVNASAHAYLDKPVVNGTKYYYVVTEVVNGAEICHSPEINATPTKGR